MSLQVWLPLNGDLNNQGLSNINVSLVSGNSFVSDGKIGNKALKLTKLQTISSTALDGAKEFSFAYWVKVNTAWEANWLDGFRWTSSDGSSTATCRQEFYTNCTLCGIWYSGGSISGKSFTPGVWTHLAGVINYNTGVAQFYINGNLVGTATNVTTTHSVKTIYIGDNGVDINENDVRIYNHCLSAKEVKEISKGLILHYKLDGYLNGLNENLFTGTIFPSGSQLYTLASGSEGGVRYTPTSIKRNTTYTISLLLRGNANMNLYKLSSGGNASIQWVNRADMSDINYNFYSLTFTTPNDRDINTLYICTRYGTSNSQPGDWFEIKTNSLKFEEGSIATQWVPAFTELNINQNIIYDTSGYGHHAVPVGTIAVTGSSPRYDVATSLDGASAIKCESNEWMAQGIESLTLNFWAKATSWPASGRIISCTESGGFNLEAGQSGYWRFPVHVYTDAAKTATAYKYDSQEIQISALTANEWNMISLVYDTTGTKTYINGELHHTYTNTSYGIHFNRNARLFIGCEANGAAASSPYFTGQVSDFRIYATALTQAAIQELYHTSASIDKSGNIYAREVVEI